MTDKCLMNKGNTVKQAIEVLEQEKVNSVFIVDDKHVLEGIFTRGDLRQFILDGGDLNWPLEKAMNPSPITFLSTEEARLYSQSKRRVVYPIVNKKHQLINVLYNTWDVIAYASESNCLENVPIVIMAGGLGTRLYPLTKVLPKALIPIGDCTITERIIENFRTWGAREFYLILNHKAEMIKAYFDDLEKDYTIKYITEDKFLGTGGGLYLLKKIIKSTFILTNCDILVNADFDCILKTHQTNHNAITLIGAVKNMPIPYGVIETTADGQVTALKEKPEVTFLSNTGVYLIESDVVAEMPDNCFCHITDLALKEKEKGKKIGVFPVMENAWLDMGQFDEMKEMIKALGIEGNS